MISHTHDRVMKTLYTWSQLHPDTIMSWREKSVDELVRYIKIIRDAMRVCYGSTLTMVVSSIKKKPQMKEVFRGVYSMNPSVMKSLLIIACTYYVMLRKIKM